MEFECEPVAEAILLGIVRKIEELCPQFKQFGQDLIEKTSTRLFDWLDHVTISSKGINEIVDLGFVQIAEVGRVKLFHHPKAQFSLIRIDDHHPSIGISVDSVEEFLLTHGLDRTILGGYLGVLRQANIWQAESQSGTIQIQAIERRARSAIEPQATNGEWLQLMMDGMSLWMTRPRFDDDEKCFQEAEKRAKKLVKMVGSECASWIVLKAERDYWQARNQAGQWQKARQDRYGLGWANHDHHTFRSSRKYFKRLVCLFESLGFYCRERFYAGREAGWGAQVMEHTNARYVLFLDVDLLDHEINIDFAHTELLEISKMSTVGLWCGLHGESILGGGMHHLEAQFSFDQMKESLDESGLGMMNPFSFFPYLKQAFSKGEVWRVNPKRLDVLFKNGSITQEQRDKFEREGALGSHLENLERNEGYKGFNKNNVSSIIRETDPRLQ